MSVFAMRWSRIRDSKLLNVQFVMSIGRRMCLVVSNAVLKRRLSWRIVTLASALELTYDESRNVCWVGFGKITYKCMRV